MKIKRFLPALMVALFLWGCGQNATKSADETVATVQHVAANDETQDTETKSVQQLFDALRAKWPKNRTINMVFHGHSVPSGYHKTPQVKPFESYPFMVYQGMNERFPTAVINCITTAIGGENSVQGAARFERDVLPYHPDLLFIDYAINDRSLKVEDVEKAWRSMIESAQKHQITLVLITPTGTRFNKFDDPTDALAIRAALIRKLGQEYKLPVADVSARWEEVLKGGTDQETLLSQGLHPNQQGHAIAAKEILRVIDEINATTVNADAPAKKL